MDWLMVWINSFRPWVVTVSFEGGKQEVFAECWKKDVAVEIYEAQKDRIPLIDDDPKGDYLLLTRAQWNKQKAS